MEICVFLEYTHELTHDSFTEKRALGGLLGGQRGAGTQPSPVLIDTRRGHSRREISRAFALLQKLKKVRRDWDNSGAGRAVERWVYTSNPTTLAT